MSEQKITLYWCEEHKQWWAVNCPDCMADTVEQEMKARTARSLIEEIEGKGFLTAEDHFLLRLPIRDWVALKEKWLGKG